MRIIKEVREVHPTGLEMISYPVFLSIDSVNDFKNMWNVVSNVLHDRKRYDDSFVAWCEELYKILADNSHGYYVAADPFTVVTK